MDQSRTHEFQDMSFVASNEIIIFILALEHVTSLKQLGPNHRFLAVTTRVTSELSNKLCEVVVNSTNLFVIGRLFTTKTQTRTTGPI